MLSVNEVKAALQKITNGTAVSISFQDSLNYVTYLFSEWCIQHYFSHYTRHQVS